MEYVKCALCGSEDSSLILTAGDYRLHITNEKFNLVQCRQCGLIYVNPRPAREEMSKFYPKEYYDEQNRISKLAVKFLQYMKIQNIMSFKKKGRILDVGCGDGSFILHFKKMGWEVYGIDTSEIAYRLATKKLGRNIFNLQLKDCHFPDSYFDVVTLNHVLEHRSDPNGELREIHRILKDGGILLLSTPNINSLQFKISRERWFGLDLPRHLYHYSHKTIISMLKKNGFNVVKVIHPLLDLPLDFFHSLKAKWLNGGSKLLKILVLPPLLIASMLIKLDPAWRGSIEVTAQKMPESQTLEEKVANSAIKG